jgi:hypothetical protein
MSQTKNVGRWLTDQLKEISTEEHKVRQRKVTLARIGNLPVTGVQSKPAVFLLRLFIFLLH